VWGCVGWGVLWVDSRSEWRQKNVHRWKLKQSYILVIPPVSQLPQQSPYLPHTHKFPYIQTQTPEHTFFHHQVCIPYCSLIYQPRQQRTNTYLVVIGGSKIVFVSVNMHAYLSHLSTFYPMAAEIDSSPHVTLKSGYGKLINKKSKIYGTYGIFCFSWYPWKPSLIWTYYVRILHFHSTTFANFVAFTYLN